ncbi:hypothetical protein FQZ97_896220 [compost metagenome]
MVAATTRISTAMLWFEPRRSRRCSCSTRNSFTCWASGMLSISSRNRVPPWACSILPMRLPWAPVKAPLSWPNSSLSKRFSGMAAQFSATKGLSARGPKSCRQRATISLPLPVSPRSRIFTGVRASSRTWRRNCSMGRETPSRRPSSWSLRSTWTRRRRFSWTRRRFSRARRRLSSSRSAVKGFSMKS